MLLIQRLRQRKNRTLRIRRNNLDILLMFPQSLCDPRNSPTCARAGHQRRNLPLRLRPNFLRGAELVRERIVRVAILVQNMCIRDLLFQPTCHADVGFGGVVRGLGGRADDFGVEGAQHGNFLGRHLFGEGYDGFVSCSFKSANCTLPSDPSKPQRKQKRHEWRVNLTFHGSNQRKSNSPASPSKIST